MSFISLLYLINMKLIEEVEDIFNISGRGCVIVPGIPYFFEPKIGSGVKIEFHNPSGSIVTTTIQALEMINRGKPMKHAPFSVDKSIKKSEIELGAKIYLVTDE